MAFLNRSTLSAEKFLDLIFGYLGLDFFKVRLWIIGKWSEICQQSRKDSKISHEELVRIRSINVAELVDILVGLVIIWRKPNESKVSTYSEINLFSLIFKRSRLKSPKM